jgi:hypothetical protein
MVLRRFGASQQLQLWGFNLPSQGLFENQNNVLI